MYFPDLVLNNSVYCHDSISVLNHLRRNGFAIASFTLIEGASTAARINRRLIQNNYLPLWTSKNTFDCCVYDNLKIFKCNECLKCFKNERGLKSHQKLH